MNHSDSHDHGSAPAVCPFTPTELEALHQDDYSAGKYIAVLTGSIFIMGLAIYSYVAYVVAY